MTPDQVTLVQRSFAAAVPLGRAVPTIFYGRLFELDPTLRQLFKGDMTEQGDKLLAALQVIVGSLTNLDKLVPVAQNLARRHVAYGVQEADYQTVGAALLYTLGQGLGDAFDRPTEAAWSEAYTTLAGVMVDAARSTPDT